jgi:hypothetical protein
MRLVTVAAYQKEEHQCWPFLQCLDEVSLSNLKYAFWKNHRKRLLTPVNTVNIFPFNADREMKIKPHLEGSAWRK